LLSILYAYKLTIILYSTIGVGETEIPATATPLNTLANVLCQMQDKLTFNLSYRYYGLAGYGLKNPVFRVRVWMKVRVKKE
jgi:hypothetical protein